MGTDYRRNGQSYGQRSLMGYSPWDRKESDMTEQLTHTERRHGFPGSGNKGLLGILGQSPQKCPGSRIAKGTQQREGWAKEEDDQFSGSN